MNLRFNLQRTLQTACCVIAAMSLNGCALAMFGSKSEEKKKFSLDKPTDGATLPEKTRETKPPVAAPDLAGDYTVTGSNPNGSSYQGTLKIIKQDEVYQFVWQTGSSFDGVGVQRDDTIAVAFGGKGCGVVHYRIESDGTLDGKWGQWGVNQSGIEKATRLTGTDLAGEYDVTGTNLTSKAYQGKLSVKQDGKIYLFKWNTGDQSEGLGIRQGDVVSVGYGGQQCGFVSYRATDDGTLTGLWGGYGTKETGTERAVRAK